MIAAATPTTDAGDETAKLVIRRLATVVLYGRPRAAIAAFKALLTLDKYYKETHARVIELSKTGRPAVAAAAVKALVTARLAHRRYQNGRSPLL